MFAVGCYDVLAMAFKTFGVPFEPGMEPLALFRTVARSERAWTKFAAGSLLDKGFEAHVGGIALGIGIGWLVKSVINHSKGVQRES